MRSSANTISSIIGFNTVEERETLEACYRMLWLLQEFAGEGTQVNEELEDLIAEIDAAHPEYFQRLTTFCRQFNQTHYGTLKRIKIQESE